MKEGCQFLCIGLSAGAVSQVGWLFWNWDVPELVVGSVAFDDWIFDGGDGDIIGL